MRLNSTCNQNKSKKIDFRGAKRRKGSTNKELWSWKWNLSSPPAPPLVVFGTNGGMGKLFLSNLADKLSRNNGESYASAISWLETCISFEISKSLHTCLRGSRTPFHKNADFLDDFSVNARNEDILKLVLVRFFRVVLVDSIFISWL